MIRGLIHAVVDAWHAYRWIRWATWMTGVTGVGAGGLAGALRLDQWVSELRDAPEYAHETPARPPATGQASPDWDWRIPAAIIILLLAVRLIAGLRIRAPRNGFPDGRDPQRLFTDADRTWISRLSGGRCEHRGLWRCHARTGLQMDHWYPWARGGATVRGNLVYLCARHNRRKTDHRPTVWATMRLRRARRRYAPDTLEDRDSAFLLDGRADHDTPPDTMDDTRIRV